MKKKVFASVLLCTALGALPVLSACKGGEELEVYCPDGAPALALTKAISDNEARQEELFDFDIVDSNQITAYVTGKNPRADICILPVNIAAKALGSGEEYVLLGTVTQGNMYFLTAEEGLPSLTKENLKEALSGKKVGVVQLTNVPGLTLQASLKDLGIEYNISQSASEEAEEGKVNLVPFAPSDITPMSGCDYYLLPEPALSSKVKGTQESTKPFREAGSLQALYGEGKGYPQAVLVAKKRVLKRRRTDVNTLVEEIKGATDYMQSAEIDQILALLATEREEGVAPSFSRANLTWQVISRCNISYVSASVCKGEVNEFLQKLMSINAGSTSLPADGFYDMG